LILVDVNLLLYAYDSSSTHHEAARAWWEEALVKPQPVKLAETTILAFLRITTHPRLHQPLSMAEAVAIVEDWLSRPMVDVLKAGERYWQILTLLLHNYQVRGSLLMDAHLAALAMEHGALLCTHDRDFQRFEGLRVEYPLL